MFWILNGDLKAWSENRKPSVTAVRMSYLVAPELNLGSVNYQASMSSFAISSPF